jgi:hypothetical protein
MRPEGTATLDRRARNAGEGEGPRGEAIGGVVIFRLREYSAPPQQQDTRADGGDEPNDRGIAERRGRVEAPRAVGGFGEDAIQRRGVGMEVGRPERRRWIT